MKLTLSLLLLVLLGTTAAALPFHSLPGFGSSKQLEEIEDEEPETLPPGYASWIISPTTVRAAILAAVTAAGIPPPVNGYVANAAANRAIRALNLEATIITTTAAPSMMGSMVNAATGSAKQAAATTAGKAAETAVSTALSSVVGHTVGDYVARMIANQVVKQLGGTVAQAATAAEADANHKQTWSEYIREKAG